MLTPGIPVPDGELSLGPEGNRDDIGLPGMLAPVPDGEISETVSVGPADPDDTSDDMGPPGVVAPATPDSDGELPPEPVTDSVPVGNGPDNMVFVTVRAGVPVGTVPGPLAPGPDTDEPVLAPDGADKPLPKSRALACTRELTDATHTSRSTDCAARRKGTNQERSRYRSGSKGRDSSGRNTDWWTHARGDGQSSR